MSTEQKLDGRCGADWLTICHGKPESELRTLKWRLFYFVNTWGVSLFYIVATRSIIDPSDVPTTWYCWSAFGQPGSTAYTVTVISALVPMTASTVWVLFCMASLVKVRFTHKLAQIHCILQWSSTNTSHNTK